MNDAERERIAESKRQAHLRELNSAFEKRIGPTDNTLREAWGAMPNEKKMKLTVDDVNEWVRCEFRFNNLIVRATRT